jgi:hypothetical protein
MTIENPNRNPADPEIIDSGVHVRDSETAPATGLQMTLVAALIVAILCVFFYGLNSQRQEVTGPGTASQQADNVPPAGSQPKASTTGQATKNDAPNPKNPQGAPRAQQPQRTNATPPQHNGGQNETQPATAPKQNQ